MESEKNKKTDVNKHDLREEISGGVPGGATKCNFVGQPPATHAEGPSVVAPEIGVHSTGQTTHQ